MAKTGPIIIVEDDADDHEIMEMVLVRLGIQNELIWFTNAPDAYAYLLTTTDQPFLIFCDINMPQQNGLDFKKQIDENPELRKKSIPFIFYSTSTSQDIVNEAYTEMTVQGFFKKGQTIEEIGETIRAIVSYWELCRHPNCL